MQTDELELFMDKIYPQAVESFVTLIDSLKESGQIETVEELRTYLVDHLQAIQAE